jgi:hypothetical protein
MTSNTTMAPSLDNSNTSKHIQPASAVPQPALMKPIQLSGLADLQDSAGTLSDIFGTPDMRKVWSDQNRVAAYLEIERALAVVQARLGIIPEDAAEEIVKHCRVEEIDWALYKKKTELIGYPVLGG